MAEPLCHDDYIVLDIETTGLNPEFAEIIEIAAVRYHLGHEVDALELLIQPSGELDEDITDLTGITPEMLADAPSWGSVFPQIVEFLGDYPIVAHNARFDSRFLRLAYTDMGLVLENKIIDTLKLSRAAFPDMPNHKLATLKSELGIQAEVSHRAMPDVVTTAKLYRLCVDELLKRGISPTDKPKRSRKKSLSSKDVVPTVSVIDSSNPLFGKTLVFTGTLSIERRDAMQIAVNCGAKVAGSVSGKTDFLIVGKQDPAIVGDDGLSGKEEKAYALNERGRGHVAFLSEQDFLQLAGQEVGI